MRNAYRDRIAAAGCLLAAPVALVASELLYTSTPDDVEQGLAVMQAHHVSELWAGLLGLLAAALFVPVVHTLAALPTERGQRLARLGNVLGTLGVVGYAAHTGMFIVFGQAAESEDRAAMARLITAMEGNAAAGVILLMFLAGLYLGLVLLMFGAARAGAVPWWAACCVLAAVVCAMIPAAAAEYAALSLVVLGLGGAAWLQLRMPVPDVRSRDAGHLRRDVARSGG